MPNLFSVDVPIMQTPMRFVSTPELVAAISESGGIGTLDATELPAKQLAIAIQMVRQATSQPFAVHLTVPQPFEVNQDQVDIVKQAVRPFFLARQLDEPQLEEPYTENFAEQMQVILDEQVPIFQFSCGVPALKWIAALKERNITILGTVTHVNEAVLLEKVGVDALVAQGLEAYGERVTFIGEVEQGMITRDILVKQVYEAVRLPVIANGGVATAAEVQSCLAAGAQLVQIGLPFASCHESDLDETYLRCVTTAQPDLVFSNAVTGRLARVARCPLIDELLHYKPFMLPYPLQYALMRPLVELGAVYLMESLLQSPQEQSVANFMNSLQLPVAV